MADLRGFRPFYAASTVSMLGDRITEVALPLTALTVLGASPMQVALLSVATWTPAVASVFIGAWIDRLATKRPVLIGCDLGRAGLLALIPILHLAGVLHLSTLYVIAFCVGTMGIAFGAASPGFFVTLVAPKDYVRANSMIGGSNAVAFVVGPAAAGWLVALLSAPGSFAVDAGSFLVSALFLARSRSHFRPVTPSVERAPLLAEIKEALKVLVRHRYLRPVMLTASAMNLANTAIMSILIVYLSDALGFDSVRIGIVLGLAGVGGVCGAVLANRIAARFGMGRAICAGAIGFNLPFGALFWIREPGQVNLLVLGLLGASAMFCVVLFDALDNSFLLAAMDDANRGKLTGGFTTINYGARPLGGLLGGVLASTLGMPTAFGLCALGGTLLAALVIFSPVRKIRDINELGAGDQ
jgi:MFS family permease